MSKKLTMIASVEDRGSKQLKSVANALKATGQAAKKTGLNFTEFNRVMFSTSAFVGMFTKSFRTLTDAMTEGARVDRVAEQFENALGPKGKFFQTISELTDNTIDRMEAMRAGISLSTLGIAGNMEEVADIVAKSGTAAKMAGMESAEGIKQFTTFLKTGSVASLSFLNMIASTNPALQAQLAILSKAGGPMGKVISTQHKMALAQQLLNTLTKDNLKGQRDLLDVLSDSSQAFLFLRSSLSTFLGTALTPLIENLNKGVYSFTNLMERMKLNDKEFLTLAKNITAVAGSLASLFAGFGTLRLVLMGLSALGLGGFPLTITMLTATVASFAKLDGSIASITKKFKLVGSSIMGVTQLMSSFLLNSDNAAEGVGYMDAKLHKLLTDNGLIDYVKWIAKAGIVTVEFGRGMAAGMMEAGKWIKTTFGGAFKSIQDMLGLNFKPWSRDIIDNVKEVGKWIGKLTAGSVGLLAALKLFRGVGGIFGSLPIIGKMFGGDRSSGPAGTASDPIYTRSLDTIAAGAFSSITKLPTSVFSVLSRFIQFAGRAATAILVFSIAAGSVKGIFEGLLPLKDGFVSLAEGVWDLSKAIYESISKFVEGSSLLTAIVDSLKESVGSILNLPQELFQDTNNFFSRILTPWTTALGSSMEYYSNLLKGTAKFVRGEEDPFRVPTPTKPTVSNADQEAFQNRIKSPKSLGVDPERKIVVSTPDMPDSQHLRLEQITKTMEMLNDSAADSMRAALTKALEDNKITPQEWVEIYKQGMDKSVVAENTKKAPERPNHSTAISRRGC